MHVFILITSHHNTPGCLTAVAFIKTAKCQHFTSEYLLTPELMPPLKPLGFHKQSKNAKTKHPSYRMLRVISLKAWSVQKHWAFLEKPLSKDQKIPNPTQKPPYTRVLIPRAEKTDGWFQSCLQIRSPSPMPLYLLYRATIGFFFAVPEECKSPAFSIYGRDV